MFRCKGSSAFRFLLVVWLLFSAFPGAAQIHFFLNNEPAAVTPERFSFFIDPSKDYSLNRFLQIRDSLRPMYANEVNLTYQDRMIWIRLAVAPAEIQRQGTKLLLNNPHVNKVGCWIFKGDSLMVAYPLTGDQEPFSSRMVNSPQFVFPVPACESPLQVVLLLDKRNEQLNIPIYLLSEERFLEQDRNYFLLAGCIGGICLMLFSVNFLLYLRVRELVYVFYALYTLVAFFYLMTNLGLIFMYWVPDLPLMSDFLRPFSLSISIPLYLLFGLALLKTKENFPLADKWTRRYLWFYLFNCLLVVFFIWQSIGSRVFQLNLMTGYQMINILLVLSYAIAGIWKKITYSGYLLFSCLVLLTSFSVYSEFLSGRLDNNFITRNIIYIGFVLEICLLAYVLSLRFSDQKRDAEILQREILQQKQRIFSTLRSHQQQLMQRLSTLLHDQVGARLSVLRLHLESLRDQLGAADKAGHLNRTILDLGSLADEVRQFSHASSPIMLEKNGLLPSIRQYLDLVNSSRGLYVQFESIGSLESLPLQYESLIYNIIQELIQNVIRHSGARQAILQLMMENELVSIYIEDDGKGTDIESMKDGLGFAQIRQLIGLVNGHVRLSTAPNEGWQVSIEFPVLKDEEAGQTFIGG